MTRKSQSQWDFGELFPTEETRDVLTVSELTNRVKRELENQIGQVWVEGEITNLRAQASGHCYFTIKHIRLTVSHATLPGQAGGGGYVKASPLPPAPLMIDE